VWETDVVCIGVVDDEGGILRPMSEAGDCVKVVGALDLGVRRLGKVCVEGGVSGSTSASMSDSWSV